MSEIVNDTDRPDGSDINVELAEVRQHIDIIDSVILGLIRQRMDAAKTVADIKRQLGEAPVQLARREEVMLTRAEWAVDIGVDPRIARDVFNVLMGYSERAQQELLSQTSEAPVRQPVQYEPWDVVG